MNIWEAYSAELQAQQHSRLSKALQSLSDSVEQVDKALPPAATGETRTSRLFASFLETDTSPAWPAVRRALDELFGKTEESKVEGVEAGARGISLVVRTLSRTVGFEADVLVLKRWMSDLDSAVTAAEEKAVARLAAGNTSSSQVVERQPSPAIGHPSPATHSSNLEQSTPPLTNLPTSCAAASSSSSFAPGPRTASASAKGEGRARSSPPAAVTITLSDTSDEADEADEEELQQQRKKRRMGSRSAGVELEVNDDGGKVDEEKLEQGKGKEVDEQVGGEDVEEFGYRRGRVGRTFAEEKVVEKAQEEQADEAMESDLTELEDSDENEEAGREQGSSLRCPNLGFQLAPLLPSILTSVPQDLIPRLSPPSSVRSYLTSNSSLDLSFSRGDVGGLSRFFPTFALSKSSPYPSKNWICLPAGQHLVGDGDGRLIAPGEPVVIFCLWEETAALLHDRDSRRRLEEGIQVFLQEEGDRWAYKGKYVLARDGASQMENTEPLERVGGWEDLHPLLKCAFDGRIPASPPAALRKTLRDCGFMADSQAGARCELDAIAARKIKGREAGRSRFMRYLVLRCVGFDEECFEEWEKRRGKGKKGK